MSRPTAATGSTRDRGLPPSSQLGDPTGLDEGPAELASPRRSRAVRITREALLVGEVLLDTEDARREARDPGHAAGDPARVDRSEVDQSRVEWSRVEWSRVGWSELDRPTDGRPRSGIPAPAVNPADFAAPEFGRPAPERRNPGGAASASVPPASAGRPVVVASDRTAPPGERPPRSDRSGVRFVSRLEALRAVAVGLAPLACLLEEVGRLAPVRPRGSETPPESEDDGFPAGGLIRWGSRLLGVDPAGLDRLAGETNDAGGVLLVPPPSRVTPAGHLGDRRGGALLGLAVGTSPAELARAVLEAVANEIALGLQTTPLEAVGDGPLLLAGRFAALTSLAQAIADQTGRPVRRLRPDALSDHDAPDAGAGDLLVALGAARLASIGSVGRGVASSDDLLTGRIVDEVFEAVGEEISPRRSASVAAAMLSRYGATRARLDALATTRPSPEPG